MQKYSLSPSIIYRAYSQGYFPLPEKNSNKINWLKPNPRGIIPISDFHTSRSLKKIIRRKTFNITYNKNFEQVLLCCSQRKNSWINSQFQSLYLTMHQLEACHSIEVWQENILVGGVFGISFAGVFFANSMFYKVSNASKVALYYLHKHLIERKFILLECQFLSEHLKQFGAVEITETDYIYLLKLGLQTKTVF